MLARASCATLPFGLLGSKLGQLIHQARGHSTAQSPALTRRVGQFLIEPAPNVLLLMNTRLKHHPNLPSPRHQTVMRIMAIIARDIQDWLFPCPGFDADARCEGGVATPIQQFVSAVNGTSTRHGDTPAAASCLHVRAAVHIAAIRQAGPLLARVRGHSLSGAVQPIKLGNWKR